jgi:hypothetical protein
VIVQHTGASRFPAPMRGIFRFRTMEEAAGWVEAAMADYNRHCCLARALTEAFFDAPKVVGRVLERALT